MLKKNWYLFTPLLLLVLPLMLFAYYTAVFGYVPKEAIKAVKYFVKSSTRYPTGYSEDKFGLISPGMDGRKVFGMIGGPFERHNDDAEWVYALAQGTTIYYHERIVVFTKDKNNVPHVKETIKRFHDK